LNFHHQKFHYRGSNQRGDELSQFIVIASFIWKIALVDYSQSHVVTSTKYLKIFQRKVMDNKKQN
jgi:hypothetical protein